MTLEMPRILYLAGVDARTVGLGDLPPTQECLARYPFLSIPICQLQRLRLVGLESPTSSHPASSCGAFLGLLLWPARIAQSLL